MTSESELRAKLKKIEALFGGAGTAGEREAAAAALDRIKARLTATRQTDPEIEMRFSIADPWSRKLFLALCRRYGLQPYRYHRQRRTTLMVLVPEGFVNAVLWPEFQQLNAALVQFLDEVTERIIREEVHGETAEAEERAEASRLMPPEGT